MNEQYLKLTSINSSLSFLISWHETDLKNNTEGKKNFIDYSFACLTHELNQKGGMGAEIFTKHAYIVDSL